MKKVSLLLISLLLLPYTVHAQEAISPGQEAYDRATANAAAQRDQRQQEISDYEQKAQQQRLERAAEKIRLVKEKRARLKAEEEQRQAEDEAAEAERAAAIAAVQKVCGDDYDQIRVGMKLSRVKKCFGDVYLHGQVKTEYGIVDQYTKGDVWIFVKKGKVVAWGD